MTGVSLPVRHAPARVDEHQANERASLSMGMVSVEWVRRRVWIPFSLSRRQAAVAASHAYADTPLPSPTALEPGAPSIAGDVVIPAAPQTQPVVYFPFWQMRGAGAEILVCATSGAVIRASRGSLRRAEIQRAIAVLALAFFFGIMAIFIADQVTAIGVMSMRPFGWPAQLVAYLAVLCGAAYAMTAIVRGLLRPALDESALEIVTGRQDFSPGPHVARLARWIAGLAFLIVVFQVLLIFVQQTAPLPLLLIVIAGIALVYASRELGRTAVASPAPAGEIHQEHSWAVAFRVYAHVLGFAIAGVFANMLLFRADLYLNAATVLGRAIETNYAEAVLVTAAVVAGVATSELNPRERRPLVVGLSVPVVATPLLGPVASIVLQFVGVTLANRYSDRRDPGKPMRGTLVRSLEIEAALVAGSLGGRLFALLLLGTPGWSVGGVIGALVTASLISAPEATRAFEDGAGVGRKRPAIAQ